MLWKFHFIVGDSAASHGKNWIIEKCVNQGSKWDFCCEIETHTTPSCVQVLPSQSGVRPNYLRDMRQSVLKDLPLDKRNPLLVTLQLLYFSLRDVVSDPLASGAKILHGLHGDVINAPLLGVVAASLITIWGLRLSFNFWRKVGHRQQCSCNLKA